MIQNIFSAFKKDPLMPERQPILGLWSRDRSGWLEKSTDFWRCREAGRRSIFLIPGQHLFPIWARKGFSLVCGANISMGRVLQNISLRNLSTAPNATWTSRVRGEKPTVFAANQNLLCHHSPQKESKSKIFFSRILLSSALDIFFF